MESPFEYILLSASKEQMLEYLESNPSEFDEAVSLACSDEQPFAWRSAWLLSGFIKPNDKRLIPYIDEIIGILPLKAHNQQRELLKIIEKMELSHEHEETVFYYCIKLWKNTEIKPGVRFVAFRIIIKYINKYPEFYSEINNMLSDKFLTTLSPGIQHSIKKLMTKLKRPD